MDSHPLASLGPPSAVSDRLIVKICDWYGGTPNSKHFILGQGGDVAVHVHHRKTFGISSISSTTSYILSFESGQSDKRATAWSVLSGGSRKRDERLGMSHRPASPAAKIGDYVNIPQDFSPEVVRNDTSDLEVVHSRQPIAYAQDDKVPYQTYRGTAADQTRVLGLKPRMFWLMIFLIIAILAIGIGAGVGAGLSAKNKSQSSSGYLLPCASAWIINEPPIRSPSSTAIPTSSAVPPSNSRNKPSPSSSPNSNPSTAGVTCPANDTLVYTPSSSSSSSNAYAVNTTTLTYTIHCGYTYDPSKDIDDIQWIPHTNLTACIDLCSIFNIQYPYGGGQYGFYGLCSGVTVSKNGTCELKTGVEVGAANADKKGDGQSAMLVW